MTQYASQAIKRRLSIAARRLGIRRVLSTDERLTDTMFLGLRLSEGIDVATVERLYAEDVIIIPPGEAVRADRAAAMEGLATLAEIDYSIEAQIRDLLISGDLAVTLVSYADTSVPVDGSESESTEGRWAIVWTGRSLAVRSSAARRRRISLT